MAHKDVTPQERGQVIEANFKSFDEFSLAAHRREALNALKLELAHYLGDGFAEKIPKATLEDFCINTIRHDHPTGEMLADLLNGFMRIYSNPATHEQAMQAFHFIDALHEQVKQSETQ